MIATHLVVVVLLAIALFWLVRGGFIQVDLFFPWFMAIVVLGFASTQPTFVNWVGARLGIQYAPVAVIFLVLFMLTGVIISLTVSVTRLRTRVAALARALAERDLDRQEAQVPRAGGPRLPAPPASEHE